MTSKTDFSTMYLTKEQINNTKQMDCCICGCGIEIDMVTNNNADGVWSDGHNAEPITEGRCCRRCYGEFVVKANELGLAAVKDQVSDIKFRKIIKQELKLKSLFKNWKPKRQLYRKFRFQKLLAKDHWKMTEHWCNHYGWFPQDWWKIDWQVTDDNPSEEHINHFNMNYFYLIRDNLLRFHKATQLERKFAEELKQLKQGEK